MKLKAEVEQNSYLTENPKAQIWHRKLGHLSYRNMKRLTKLCEGLNLTSEDLKEEENMSICAVCQEAKQVRIKFGEQRNRATRLL